MTPQALSIVGLAYTGAARARAFAIYGLVMGLAAACGQLIGGLLIHVDLFGLDWRTCFLVNVPIGLAALALAPYAISESRADGATRLDLPGAALATLSLLAVVLPLVLGREHGWLLWTWLSLAVVGALFYGALGANPTPDDVAHAFEVALIAIAGLSLAVSLLVQLLPARAAAAE